MHAYYTYSSFFLGLPVGHNLLINHVLVCPRSVRTRAVFSTVGIRFDQFVLAPLRLHHHETLTIHYLAWCGLLLVANACFLMSFPL